jgi:hypothetical protein
MPNYLKATRDDLIWKLDGLSKREARLPRTETGNNLPGALKHRLNVEAATSGEELVAEQAFGEDTHRTTAPRAT